MNFNVPTYVWMSFLMFGLAFALTLRSFLTSDMMKSVSDCYTADLDTLEEGLRWMDPDSLFRQPPMVSCNSYVGAFITFVESQKISLLFHVNMPICCSILLGRAIIKSVFGELWSLESQHMYDRMLNFLLFKVIFIGAVMDPVWRHILRLSMWIGILGFLRIFSLLSRDRFENLATVAYVPSNAYYKITGLLCGIFILNIIWYIGSLILFPNSLTFLTLEFLPVALDTTQVIAKYLAHLLDQSRENGFESKRLINYYTEISADVLILGCTLLQYLQLMWMHGVSFGLVDIVLFLNVRSVLKNLHSKVLIHRERWRAMTYVQSQYVDATDAELNAYDDDCAICRDELKTAKKLSCGHLFHFHHVQIGTAYTHGSNITSPNQHAQHADVACHRLRMRNSLNQHHHRYYRRQPQLLQRQYHYHHRHEPRPLVIHQAGRNSSIPQQW